MELSDYGMSREGGYLSHYEIDAIVLPEQFDPILEAALQPSPLLTTGRVRRCSTRCRNRIPVGGWLRGGPAIP